MNHFRGQLLIDGVWTPGAGSEMVSTDPTEETVLWAGTAASPEQVDAAVEAARAAGPGWSGMSVAARREVLEGFVALVDQRGDELALAITREVGKPRWEGKTEVGSVRGKLAASVYAYEQRAQPTTVKAGTAEATTIFRPLGAVAVLGPFNFPAHMPNGHVLPALLAGNTVVFKPSDLTPLVAEVYTSILHDAGIPAGVFNLVHGGADVGARLSAHQDINGVFFNGSRQTGVAINKSLAAFPEKLIVLEMGGNNALVIWDYADERAAVHLAVQSCYVTSGQRCTAARRLIVPEADDQLIASIADAIGRITVGAPEGEPAPFMGPVVSKAAAVRLLEQQADLRDRGADIVVEMAPTETGLPFLRPGLVDITDAQGVPDDEIFGPLLQVQRVANFESAIAAVNTSRFGLAAGVVTQDRTLFDRFVAETRSGIVNWNQQLTGASGMAPFGGVGLSGNHRPSGFAAVDYCSDAIGGLQSPEVVMPEKLSPGLDL